VTRKLLTDLLQWLEREGVFHVAGLGDEALDWEPGAGPLPLSGSPGLLHRIVLSGRAGRAPCAPGSPMS